jgi:hypothetical protein
MLLLAEACYPATSDLRGATATPFFGVAVPLSTQEARPPTPRPWHPAYNSGIKFLILDGKKLMDDYFMKFVT